MLAPTLNSTLSFYKNQTITTLSPPAAPPPLVPLLGAANTSTEMPLDIVIVGTIAYVLIFIVGVCGNILVIYVLLKEKELRNFTNYLLANLSVADLMVLFTCVPSGLHDLFAKERWYLGEIPCYLVSFIENVMGISSILTIFFITCERYYVICRPMCVKSFMTQSRTLKLVIFIWLVSILANLPFIFTSNYRLSDFYDGSQAYKCYIKLDSHSYFYYTLIANFLVYFFIGILLLAMYYKIYFFLHKSNEFLLSCSRGNSRSPSCQNNNINNRNNDNNNNNNRLSSYLSSNSFKLDQTRSSLTNKHLFQVQQLNELSKNFDIGSSRKSILHLRTLHGSNLVFLKRDLNNEETIIISNINNKLSKYVRQRKRIIAMLVTLIAVFYVCLFPLKIWNLILLLLGSKPYFTLRQYWYILAIYEFSFCYWLKKKQTTFLRTVK